MAATPADSWHVLFTKARPQPLAVAFVAVADDVLHLLSVNLKYMRHCALT